MQIKIKIIKQIKNNYSLTFFVQAPMLKFTLRIFYANIFFIEEYRIMSVSREEQIRMKKQEKLETARRTINVDILNNTFDYLAYEYAPPYDTWKNLHPVDRSFLYTGDRISQREKQHEHYLMYLLTLVAKDYDFETPIEPSDREEPIIRRILTNLNKYPTTLFDEDTPDTIRYAVCKKLQSLALAAFRKTNVRWSLGQKSTLSAVQNVMENRTSMNASVSVGPASLVASYLGVAPPKHSVNNSGSSIRWTKKPSKGTKTRNNTKSKTNKTKNNTNSKNNK